ncbi:hypothetical protein EV363DRAFT_1356587 [Boletus edulis]|uniref:Methyltransferase n=1 Tax=Boletus edulis BED1 TaxID=1328754 RepID=A0AAD4G6L4_BOLED|nr:hypothetical protein EV363DRAFT_1356587 [Boletus edulis]KAF8421507.1 hypothetical protein L210DRAFT_3572777 [Boletus edulis BED1]
MSTPSTARLQMPTVCDFDPLLWTTPHEPLGVIELGSGTSMVAVGVVRVIRAATPGGFVIATDLPDVCPLLQHHLHTSTSREIAPT